MERGFSLLELMIAVAVMAILTLIAYPSYNSYMASAKRAEAKGTTLNALLNTLLKKDIELIEAA